MRTKLRRSSTMTSVRSKAKPRQRGSTRSRPLGPNPGFRPELRVVLADVLDGRADTQPGLMFGFPAFYAAGKLVACVYGTGIAVRLSPEQASELRGEPSRAFEPYGRPMRAWTFLEPATAEELWRDAAVLEAAIERAKRDGTAK
jgi:hypothetical protein